MLDPHTFWKKTFLLRRKAELEGDQALLDLVLQSEAMQAGQPVQMERHEIVIEIEREAKVLR